MERGTLNAGTQISRSTIAGLEAVRKSAHYPQGAIALPILLACLIACPSVAQSTTGDLASAKNEVAVPASAGAEAATTPAPPAEIDAPQPQPSALSRAGDAAAAVAVPMDQPGGYEVAPLHRKYILTNMRAQTLRSRDKVIIGLQGTYSLMNFGGMLFAAGWEQLRNGEPNYGTDRGAFGERLGAAAIRGTSQGVFTDSVFAPLLHEDPRYYVQGSQYSILHRAFYAASRPLITRTDSGRTTINASQLLGYTAATALNNAFYPPANRNVADNAKAFAGSIGGSALSYLLAEFTASLWTRLHIGR